MEKDKDGGMRGNERSRLRKRKTWIRKGINDLFRYLNLFMHFIDHSVYFYGAVQWPSACHCCFTSRTSSIQI